MIRLTLNCVRPTQFNVIYTDYSLQYWYEVVFVQSPKCLVLIIVIYLYFIHILQGSVDTYIRCGGMYNNCIIAKLSAECASERILTIGQ